MNLTLALYLVNILDRLSILTILVAIIGLISVIIGIIYIVEEKDVALNVYPILKKLALMTCVAGILTVIIPNEKTMYLMMASSVTKEIAENPKFQEVGNRLYNIVNQKLDELENNTAVKATTKGK